MNQPNRASRGTSIDQVGPLLIAVLLPVSTGALSVGDYLAGKTYTVPAAEAIRLVDVKRFQYATPADAQLAATHIETSNATVIAPAEVAAAASGGGGGATTANPEE